MYGRAVEIADVSRHAPIWLVGDSIIYWAHQWWWNNDASAHMAARVVCFAVRGANISSTKASLMAAWTSQAVKPAAIVIHVGTNDLGQLTCIKLREQLADLWTLLSCMLPTTRLIWSDIIPKAGLRTAGDVGALDCQRIDRMRRDTNRFARRLCTRHGGRFVTHPEITLEKAHLYRADGLHLSNAGCHRFMRDFDEIFAAY